jgi:hypothetical protein
MIRHEVIRGKDVWFIERERYYAFVAEHEVILIPRCDYPVQVKRYSDAVKATTLEREWVERKGVRVLPYKQVSESIWKDYLGSLGYRKEDFISDIGSKKE